MLFKFKHSSWCIGENVEAVIFVDAFWKTFIRNPWVCLLASLERVCRLSWFWTGWVAEQALGGTVWCWGVPRGPVWQEPGKAILVLIKIFIKNISREASLPPAPAHGPGPFFSPPWDYPWWCSWIPCPHPSPSPRSCPKPRADYKGNSHFKGLISTSGWDQT